MADQAAKEASRVPFQASTIAFLAPVNLIPPSYSTSQCNTFLDLGASPGSDGWLLLKDRYWLLKEQVLTILTHLHGIFHIGACLLYKFLEPLLYSPKLLPLLMVLPIHVLSMPLSLPKERDTLLLISKPHQHRETLLGVDPQLDFTHMPPCKGNKYLLVMESFPTKKETAEMVATGLIQNSLPPFGFLRNSSV